MELALDGLFVGKDGRDGLILQVWSRPMALNTSLPISAAVLQDVRERRPGGLLWTLSVERYFRLPEGSPMVAALLDELGVDVAAQWGPQWRRGTLATGSFTVTPPRLAEMAPARPTAAPPPERSRPTEAELFFQFQQATPGVRPRTAATPRASEPGQAVPQRAATPSQGAEPARWIFAPSPPQAPRRQESKPLAPLIPLRDAEPPLPFMQYLCGDMASGDRVRIEVEDTALQVVLELVAPGVVREVEVAPCEPAPRPRKALMICAGKCIELLLPGCRLLVWAEGISGRLAWRTGPLPENCRIVPKVSRPA